MCGILGWMGARAVEAASHGRFQEALNALRPRGPDGMRLEQGPDWMLGHTRLAILDLSDNGAQPMRDEQGRWLVFNGEIYNFQQLRSELEREGCTFHSTGDAEVLLKALGHWGVAVLPRLRGMFAFGWLDPVRKELILARDRYGVKPLSWEATSDGIRFASDLFALDALAGGTSERCIDEEAVWSYLLLGHVPAPATIWKGVRKLLPGHYLKMTWEGTGGPVIEIHAYWQWPSTALSAPSPAYPGGFREHAREALRFRLISDVPVGLLLSGGIDSSLAAALCSELPEARIPCFTMGFHDAASDERPAAGMLARHLHLKHETFEAEETPVEVLFEDLWRAYDEPFADSSAMPMLLLCREIQKHVKVAISGDGGDEVWCGYPWHRALWRGEQACVPPFAKPLLRCLSGSRRGGLAYKARVLAARDRLEMWTVLKTGLNETMARSLPLELGRQQPAASVFREAAARIGEVEDVLDWACWMDLTTYLPEDLMVKADRASMHVGLELREPFLDHEFTAWGLGLPSSERFDSGTGLGKQPARRYLHEKLPADMLNRPKQGFTPPLHQWLAGPLKSMRDAAVAALESGALAPLALPKGISSWEECARRLCDEHDQFLWRVVCFYGWHRARVARRASEGS
ncbi:MAG: asparagine synthase (glutamine-hydrolyzing) [Verrucomicrobiaceae bacterium]